MALSVDNKEWRTAETIKLLEAYLETDQWSKRAAALQRLFGKVAKYTEDECKRRMDAIFAQPTPDTVPGVLNEPHHSRKVVEAWLIHFRQKAESERKHAEQMRQADERLLIDLIERFRAGKITNEEIQARLEAQREIDRRRPDAEEYEKKTMEQVRKHAHTAVDAMLKAKSAKEFLLKSDLIPGSGAASIPTPVVSPAKQEVPAQPLEEGEVTAAIESSTDKAAPEQELPLSVRKTPSPLKITLEQQRSPPAKAKEPPLADVTDVIAVASPPKNPAPTPQKTPIISPQKAPVPSPQKTPTVSPQQAPASPPRQQMKSPPRAALPVEPKPDQIAVSSPSPKKPPSPKAAVMEQEESLPGSPFPEATVEVEMIDEELTPSLVDYSPSPEKSPEKESSDDGKRVLRERKVSPMKSPASTLASTKQAPAATTPERKTRSQAVKSPPPVSAAPVPQSPSDLLSPELGKPPASKATPRKTSIAATVSHPSPVAEEKMEEEKSEVQEESDLDDIIIVLEEEPKPRAEEAPGPRITRRASKLTEDPPQAISARRQSRRSIHEHPSGASEADAEAISEKEPKTEKVQVPMASRGPRRQSSRLNITYTGDAGAASTTTTTELTMPTLRKRRPTGGSEISTDISAPQTPHASVLAEIPETLDPRLEEASEASPENAEMAAVESRKRTRSRVQLQEKKPGKESPIPMARRSRATSGASTPAREEEVDHAKASASVKKEVHVTSSAAQTRVSVRHDLKQKFASIVAIPVRARSKTGRGDSKTPEVGVQTGTVQLTEHDAVYYEESMGPLSVITISMDDDSESIDIPMPHHRCGLSNCGAIHRKPALKEPAKEETYEEQEEEEKEETHTRPSSSVPTARRSRQRQEEPVDDEPKAKRARKDAPRSSRASERLSSAAPTVASKSRHEKEPLVPVDIVKEKTTSAESSLQAKLQERKPTEKAVLMNIWRQISSASNSGHFSTPVSEKDVPGYSAVIDHPVDLATIRAQIDDGTLCTLQQLKETFDLMFTNATVFNAPDHEVALAANALWKDANVLIKELEGSSESESSSKRAVRARKAASRSEALSTVQFFPSMTPETTVKEEPNEEGATGRVIFSRRATSKCATGHRKVVN
ncbi:Brd8 protein [Aphelenchoides avenae]|nr:Brd8 protein [Aphelenchus avenae]